MLSRRSFLGRAGQVCAGAWLGAPFIRASDKSGRKLPVLGSGAHVYECIHDWLVPPDGMVWGNTHGVCQDADRNIYIAHTVHPSSRRDEAVAVYDAKGRFIRAFGKEFKGGAHGLDIRKEAGVELLYHCDTKRCEIVKTTLQGEVVWIHGYPSEDPHYGDRAIKFVPTNVAFFPNGDFLVADGYGSHYVLRFTREGKYAGVFAKPGRDTGELNNPHGLWVDVRGREPVVVIADRGNRRIQVFSMTGAHLQTVEDKARLRLPCDFDLQGEWMVCPDLDSQVLVLDRNYQVVAQLGDGQATNGAVGSRRTQSREEFTPGQFITPHDATFLHNGDILVVEWLRNGRITRLRKT